MAERLDRAMLLVILFLVGLGLVQVYSSSYIYATETYGSGLYFFMRQGLFAMVGVGLLFVMAALPWRLVFIIGFVLSILAVIGLMLTYVPGIGVKAGGAARWLRLPWGLRFEPAELFKISLPFLIATFFLPAAGKPPVTRQGLRYIFLLVPFALLLKQPDFGTFVLGVCVCLSILFVFGLRWIYILMGAVLSVPAFYFLVWQVPYRMARIRTYLDPWADPADSGFQVIQSLLGFHSGGVWGAGAGQGQGKLFFLPEAHTDFTLSVLGEELGFVGFFLVMMLYGFLIFRGLQTASQAQVPRARAVALGLTVLFALSVFINVGVALGMVPTKGLTLPFLSYGGSSLVCTCLAFGCLLNIRRQIESSPRQEAVRLARI